MAQVLYTDGTVKNVQPKNGTDFKLEEIRELIKVKWIEIVRVADNMILVVDEEGKLNGLEYNPLASLLYPNDSIVGNALYCRAEQII